MTEYNPSEAERAFWAALPDCEIREGFATVENQGGPHVSPEREAAFDAWLAQAKSDAAEARLARASALLDQVQRVQGYQVIAVDRVRRALGEKTP